MELRGFRSPILLSIFLFVYLCLIQSVPCLAADVSVAINELMASNLSSVADPQGQYDDWIELYNAGDSSVDLGGFYLTDDASEPRKWQIPTGNPTLTTIPAKGYLVIWADGDTGDPGLHASFSLKAGGDEVALFHSDGVTRLDRVSFGPQAQNLSYGRYPDGGDELRLMVVPTPGEANVGITAGVVADVQFSHPRGFYDNGFSLELTTATEDAVIYYTLDGRDPLAQGVRGVGGTKYAGPIPITRTTCVRAGATKTAWISSQTVTHSYIFPSQVIRQSTQPQGFPTSWGGRTVDYAMDSRVVDDPAYRDEIRDDLKSTPSVCISLSNDDFFGTDGIYSHPMGKGDAWERPASMEWIDPASGDSFGVNAGLRIHGGDYSRSRSSNPKNGLQFFFRGEYGTSVLEYPLFPDTDVKTFKRIGLREIWNYSWIGDGGNSDGGYGSDYLRDLFARDIVRDMGRLTPHGRPVQVYINGLYWGMYILTERIDDDFAADHLGGDGDDYDVLEAPSNQGGGTVMKVLTGDKATTPAEWDALFAMSDSVRSSPKAYQDIQQYVDLPAMIDYMLMIYYTGSRDAPVFLGDQRTPRNFSVVRSNNPAGPFLFVPWDVEWSLESPYENRTGIVGVRNPHYLMDRLAANADFRILLADRIYRYFYNGGVLTRESVTARYTARAQEIHGAIVGESARWGDVKRSVPFTREDWQNEVDRLVTQYFSGRTETVLSQLKSRGWYPSVDAPVFQINGKDQHGGAAPSQASLGMTKSAAGGTIWYTLDGSDPRVPGTTAVSDDLTLLAENAAKRVLVPTAPVDNAWRGGADFDDSTWISGAGGVGYERSTGYEQFFTIDVQAGMYAKNGSCLIRIPFDVAAGDLSSITSLMLDARYDDGFVAYINGSEVARTNAAGEPVWNSRASAGHSDLDAVEFETVPLIEHVGKLRAGRNILAIQGMNDSTTSSDFLISVTLTAGKGAVGTPSGVSATAVAYANPLTLDASVQVKARVLSGTTWSALHDVVFAVGPVAESLRISEIMYHPLSEISDLKSQISEAEYIELTNIGAETINLNLVRFTNGVDFTFPSVKLAPGGYCLVVKDRPAFETRYSANLPVIGEYTGSLSNAGERIELRDAAGTVIHNFRFEDNWYKATDGAGYSLTVTDPATVDPNALGDPSVWQPSEQPGGSPGSR